ncbi:MAG: acyltransferase [Flavobacteriia bacterium]|nr:acyltransferase [Flavobacteriia bacterium]NBP28154.1 acyltransferase [Flavobacteriia bacterium]
MKSSNSLFHRVLRRLVSMTPTMRYGIRDASGARIKGTRISSHTFIDHPEQLTLGKYVYIGHFNVIEASHGIEIGEGTQITTHCVITSHSSHQSIRLYGPSYAGKEMIGYVTGSIHIGRYSFIGPHSTLMPGTKLGKGCLVQAYSYLKGEFPDYAIIGGNPAKIIGDTRELDEKFLSQHPELKLHYESWTST